jgi:hypothetical protein
VSVLTATEPDNLVTIYQRTWAQVRTENGTWQDVKNEYVDWMDLRQAFDPVFDPVHPDPLPIFEFAYPDPL